MPTYAYRCTECGYAFDIHQEFTDDALTACSECSGRLRKVFGSIGVSFKGSGFYRNDSRASGTAKSGNSKSGGSQSGDSKSASSSTSSSSSSGSSSSADKSSTSSAKSSSSSASSTTSSS